MDGGNVDMESAEHLSTLSCEQRLRDLELELAQTILALVEEQCKNQELSHRMEELSSGKSRGRNWGVFKKK